MYRDSSIKKYVSLSPDQHLVSNVAQWRTGSGATRNLCWREGAEIMGGPSPSSSPIPRLPLPALSYPVLQKQAPKQGSSVSPGKILKFCIAVGEF